MSDRAYRIAMVAPGPFPAPRGSQVLVRELAEALSAAGHRVHVVAYAGGDAYEPVAGVTVHRTPRLLGGGRLFGPRWWRLAVNLALLTTLYRLVRRERIDVIHAHNYEAPMLGYAVRALTGVPVVYHGHNVMSDELGHYFRSRRWKGLATAFGRLLDRSVPRRADYVVALSQPMAEFLLASGVAPHQLAVIPPGVAPGSNDPSLSEAPPGFAGPGPEKLLVYAGNLDPYQEIETLVRAMVTVQKIEPEARLVLATHTADANLIAEIARLGLSGTVSVWIPPSFEAVRQLLRRADILLCPRASWSGFPIKLLNYMAAGRAIIAAAGAAGALDDPPMVVVPNGDDSKLASAIIATLGDPFFRARLGRAARRAAAERFSWSHIIPQIVAVYQAIGRPDRGQEQPLQSCKNMLQKATVWELMKGLEDRIHASDSGIG